MSKLRDSSKSGFNLDALKRSKSEKKGKGAINDSLRTSGEIGEDSTEKSESAPLTARGTSGRIKLSLKPSSKELNLSPSKEGGRERLDSNSSQKTLKIFSGSSGRTRMASGSVSASDSPNFQNEEAILDALAFLLLSSPFDNPRQATPFKPFSVTPLVYTPFDPYDLGAVEHKTIKYLFTGQPEDGKNRKRDMKKLVSIMGSNSQKEQFRNYLKALDYHFYFDFWAHTNNLLCGEVPLDKIDHVLVQILDILGIGSIRKIDLPLSTGAYITTLETQILAGTWNISHLQPLQEVVTDVLLQHLRNYQS